MDGKEGWMSSDGSRLRDFGVDEDEDEEEDGDENENTEIISDDDDIPLGELRRRLVARQRG
jgi:palmitoyltransferase